MVLPFSSTIFFLTALFLGYFSYKRFLEMRRDPDNVINFHYFRASLYVSSALFFYALSASLFSYNGEVAIMLAKASSIAAVLLNALGFSHFFLISLYNWLSLRNYVIARHILYLFIFILLGMFIVSMPKTYVDTYTIVHWRFSFLVGFFASLQMTSAFACNLILLGKHFYRLKTLSLFNVSALMITFVCTGFAGTYQYMGDNSSLLAISLVFLYIGIATVFFSVVHKKTLSQ